MIVENTLVPHHFQKIRHDSVEDNSVHPVNTSRHPKPTKLYYYVKAGFAFSYALNMYLRSLNHKCFSQTYSSSILDTNLSTHLFSMIFNIFISILDSYRHIFSVINGNNFFSIYTSFNMNTTFNMNRLLCDATHYLFVQTHTLMNAIVFWQHFVQIIRELRPSDLLEFSRLSILMSVPVGRDLLQDKSVIRQFSSLGE